MAWDDTFVYGVTKITSAQLNAIIAKIKSIAESDLSLSDNTTNDVSTSKHGFFPKFPGGSGFLRADGQWAATGAGDITGSTGSTDDAIITADGTGGATFQGSLATVNSSGSINIPSGQKYKINGTALAYTDITGAGSGTVTHSSGALTSGGVVVGNGTDDIKIATDIPTATTIGSAYIYRAGGTDVPYTDGGTGISTYPKRTIFLSGAGGIASTTSGNDSFTTTETSTNKVNFRASKFIASASDASHEWGFVLPANYDGGTVTATPYFHCAAGTEASSHTVIWNVQGVCFADGETMDTAYGTLQTSTTTFASSKAGKLIVGATTSAITLGGTPAGGEWCQIRAQREGDDTNTDAQYLLGIKIVYQTNGTSDE
jgi:hypothetical protein